MHKLWGYMEGLIVGLKFIWDKLFPIKGNVALKLKKKIVRKKK